jgi:predicted MPP superfamily phosphohydrolase
VRRLLSPFVIVLSTIVAATYAYAAWRLTSAAGARWLLAIPFLLVWLVPIVYWVYDRESTSKADELLHAASYLSMGWLNFLILLLVARDGLLGLTVLLPFARPLARVLEDAGPVLVFAGSFLALGVASLAALRGPRVVRVEVPVAGLDPRLAGTRIVQISDLHVGPTIGRRYVRRVVSLANELAPDLVALTGDLVDGPVDRLARHVQPLADLMPKGRAFVALGNHDYYSGAAAWIAHFESMGLRVLSNDYATMERGGARVIVGGVVDPAVRLVDRNQSPRPDLANAPEAGQAFRLLLAHNPKLALLGEAAGFDLQLSGHTHAGQFFPWTLAVQLVHAPHVAGLSRRGRMWVYVNAGTGSWGPPVRFGTEPELTLLELVPSA